MQTQIEMIKGLVTEIGAMPFANPHRTAMLAHLRAAVDAGVNDCRVLQTMAKDAEAQIAGLGKATEAQMANFEKLKAAAAAVADQAALGTNGGTAATSAVNPASN